jgi:hypothetical protein
VRATGAREGTVVDTGDPEPARSVLLGGLADAVPHLVWVAGRDGVVREYSGRIEAYAGVRRPAGGWAWEAMVHPYDRAGASEAWLASIE